VFLKDQVLEAPKVEGRLYVSRKARRHDEWDPPGGALRPGWTGRLARLRRHHVSAYGMTVIDNAEPVIDNARRAQVCEAMVRYRKRPN
jgi:hypothetical protein